MEASKAYLFCYILKKKWPSLVVNIDNGNKSAKVFVGRVKEINEILERLKDNKSNKGIRLLLVGESGIGKSALLDEIHRRLTQEQQDDFFVGYYDTSKALVAESQSFTYPFNIVLASLIENIKSLQQIEDKVDSTLFRIKNALLTFAKEEGMNIAESIVEDAAKKAGFEQTLKVIKNFWKTFKAEKTSLMQAENAVARHKEDDLRYYLNIFRSLANEFEGKRFVLVFDQFEYVGKASTDFFLNFVKLVMPKERFHIIVSFKTDDTIWNDPDVRKLYEDLERKLTHDLDGKKISISGLSVEDIDEWIKLARHISLPRLNLQRIRGSSAGLPILLDEWIRTSVNLNDYEDIDHGHLCSQIIRLQEGLDKHDQARLYRMSVLYQPLKPKELAKYLKIDDNVDFVMPFIIRLIHCRIFDEYSRWFRHELVQKCFQLLLDEEYRTSYHADAAKFFEDLQKEETKEDRESYIISNSYAYHLHNAGEKYLEKSFTYNKELAEHASRIGDLNIAERCYKRAINDAKNLARTEDEMGCLLNMTYNVYHVFSRYEEAMANYQTVLEYSYKANQLIIRTRVLNNIAAIHLENGKYEQALQLYKQSLEIKKQQRDWRGVVGTLNNIAIIHYKKGEYEQALQLYKESLEASKQIRDQQIRVYDQQMEARTINNIAIIHYKKGEYEQALQLYKQSLEIKKQQRDWRGVVSTLNNMALIYEQIYEYDQALQLYKQSLEMSRQRDDQNMVAKFLNNIGVIHYKKGEYEQALQLYKQSLEIKESFRDQVGIAYTLHNIAQIHYTKKEYDQALYHGLQAVAILKRFESPELQKSAGLLSDIKDKLGSEAYENLVEKVKSTLIRT